MNTTHIARKSGAIEDRFRPTKKNAQGGKKTKRNVYTSKHVRLSEQVKTVKTGKSVKFGGSRHRQKYRE